MRQSTKRRPDLRVPKWLPVFYGAGVVAMMPWIIYLQDALPNEQSIDRWVLTWVGYDCFITALIITVVILALRKSAWLNLALVALATTLTIDAWFDIVTSNGSRETILAVALAIFFELPWAVLSLSMAIRLNRQLIKKDS